MCFICQAEDGIRSAQESRGLGNVYKRQVARAVVPGESEAIPGVSISTTLFNAGAGQPTSTLSLIHI